MKAPVLLLILAIPFALYAAWQVQALTRTDLIISEAPHDTGKSQEQLAAAHAKAAAWSNETRKAVAVSGQFRAASAEDASTDAAVTAVLKASAARTADLNDLDQFLSGVEKPAFTGKLKPRYDEWMLGQAALRTDALAVADWLARPLQIASPADADKAMASVLQLINQYVARSKFADKGTALQWRLRARLTVTDALGAVADKQYATAIGMKLPLKPEHAATALNTYSAMKAHIAALHADAKQADADKVPLPPAFRAALDAKHAIADEYTARTELLALFAQEDLFTSATGATPWLKQVAMQYARTKDEKVRALIRTKVQEFCDAFIPLAVRLDDEVLVGGIRAPREQVVVSYELKVGDKSTSKPLTSAADGFNEFELAKKPPGFNHLVKFAAKEYELKDLKPTEHSNVAAQFNRERAKLGDIVTAPRWSLKSVAELKKLCDAQKDLVDQLRTPGSGTAAKIATRVAALTAGMEASKELFD